MPRPPCPATGPLRAAPPALTPLPRHDPPLKTPSLLCCGSHRREEAATFSLWVTPTAIHFSQMQYACGFCCAETVTKNIPLDKIQDVELRANCCGDCCGCSEGKMRPYELHVQTAGAAGPDNRAELSVYCLEDVNEFRDAVLKAKRELTAGSSSGGGAAGAGKGGEGLPGSGDASVIVRVLERIEKAIHDASAAHLAQHPR